MSTFLDVVELLLTSSEAKSSYTENPAAFMESHGLESLDSTDVADAMTHASNALPLPVSVLLDPSNGLDSAAEIMLEDNGLSLERAPMLDDVGSEIPDDLDLDLDPYGSDVAFDSDDAVPVGAVEHAADSFDAPDGSTESSEVAALTAREIVEATPVAELTNEEDLGDFLTDSPIDVPYLDDIDPLDTIDDGERDSPVDLEDLDPDNQLTDDFDLLD